MLFWCHALFISGNCNTFIQILSVEWPFGDARQIQIAIQICKVCSQYAEDRPLTASSVVDRLSG